MLHAHLAQSTLGGSAREEETEEISNGGGGWNELVNSTIPHYAIYISSGRRIVGWDVAQRSKTAAHQRSKIVQPIKRSIFFCKSYSVTHKTVRTDERATSSLMS
jgi:hypothetical protein